jgi:hypothetical protein
MADGEALKDRDRRRHRRFCCSGEAEVVAFNPGMLFRGKVRDISRSGCFVETSARLRLTRMAEVELLFTARGVQFRSLARVMDVRPGKGAGFEFLPGDPRMDASFVEVIEALHAEAEEQGE